MFESKILLVICVIISVSVSGSIITPCKGTDKACILSSAKDAFPKLMRGIPELGVPASDPLHFGTVNGDLSTMKFVFKNGTAVGFSGCDLTEIDYNLDKSSISMVTICPETSYTGSYTISGRLIGLPIEGEGTFTIVAEKYKFSINAAIKKVQGKDGKDHLSIKNFNGKAEPLGPIIFDLKNLFNGQKDLSDVVHKFANENYKEVSDFAVEPLYYAVTKEIFKNVNKYFKVTPLEEIELQN